MLTVLLAFFLCVDPTVNLSWSKASAPVAGTDYTIGSGATPNVALLTGDAGWHLCSSDADNPGNLGDVGTVTSPAAGNFGLTIDCARNVTSVSLDPTASTNWSRLDGSIGGDCGTVFLQKSTVGTGGELNLSVGVTASGSWTVPKLQYLSVQTLNASLAVTQKMEWIGSTATIDVQQGTGASSLISLADTVGPCFVVLGSGGEFGQYTIAGDLTLSKGVKTGQQVEIVGALASTATIDLKSKGVADYLALHGGGSGSIINGGSVTGLVALGNGSHTFTGSATFSGIPDSGTVWTEANADFPGTLHVTGQVGGGVTVLGTLTGAITLDKDTTASSFIELLVGLGSSGSLTLNNSRGGYDAGGAITLGLGVPSSVTFDGSIKIMPDCVNTPPVGGDLTGSINVNGCHATSDPLDVCIAGSGAATVNQSGCANQVTVQCGSMPGCP